MGMNYEKNVEMSFNYYNWKTWMQVFKAIIIKINYYYYFQTKICVMYNKWYHTEKCSAEL